MVDGKVGGMDTPTPHPHRPSRPSRRRVPFTLPSTKPGRPFSRDTALGQIMATQGWTVAELGTVTGIYVRTLSDYLASRRKISDAHLTSLADALEVNVEDLL